MAITLITGPANSGKAELVMEAVRAHAARDSRPLLIVPTRADVEHYRRELAAGGALMGVEIARFRELLSAIVRCAGENRPVLGSFARLRMLEAIVARQTSFGPGASPGFLASLERLVAELQVQRASPARLRRGLEAAAGAGSATSSLAGVYDAYLRALRRSGRADEEQLAVSALDALRREPSLWGERPVLFYGFDDLTPLQRDAIQTLGAVVGADVTVSLAYEPGRVAFAGRAATFNELAPLAGQHHQLGPRAQHYATRSRAALSHLERSLFEDDARCRPPQGAVRLLAAADERSELQAVAAHIEQLLRDGMAPAEIAVVARTSGASAGLLEGVFRAAGIPFAMPRRVRFADSSIGSALIGLLRCVPRLRTEPRDADDASSDREPAGIAGSAQDLLAFLRAPGVLTRPGLADGLERELRRAGTDEAQRALALWEERHWPLGALEELRLAQERGPGRIAARAERQLLWLFSAARRRGARVLDADESLEAAALAGARRALGELRELARATRELAPRDAFALAQALSDLELPAGEQPSPRTVAVLDPLALRARRVRALFVCRMQEGAFPSWGAAPGLLGDDERRALAEASGLVLGAEPDALAAERYLFYAAASRPEELLVLSWHAASEDGVTAARSLFVDDICDLFDESLEDDRLQAPDAQAAAGAHAQRQLSYTGRRAGGLGPLRDRELLAELNARTWSPSSLGVWQSCPVRWLVERVLHAEDLDPDPEPLARGSLAHAALAQTLDRLRRVTGSARLTVARLPLARDLLAAALAENAPRFELSASPQRAAAARRRLHADLARYLEHAAAQDGGEKAPGALVPRYLELGFGFDGDDDGDGANTAGADNDTGDAPLPALDIGGGVLVRGRIDRVDANDAGEAVVYDYKGASVAAPAKWAAQGDLQIAVYMRAVQELLGLRAVGGFYQPLSGSDLRARGVLEAGAGVQLQCVGDDARDPEQVRELLEAVLAAAREAAGEAASGRLEARPATCAFKGGCSFPAICRRGV
jgi:PD-(D/E)XK nuclease superfamily